MVIPLKCTGCNRIIDVPDSFAGKKGKCPYCLKVLDIPAAREQTEPEAPTLRMEGTQLPQERPENPANKAVQSASLQENTSSNREVSVPPGTDEPSEELQTQFPRVQETSAVQHAHGAQSETLQREFMKFCPGCGRGNERNNAFCPECGTNLKTTGGASDSAPFQTDNASIAWLAQIDPRAILGAIGSFLLFIGVFCPIFKIGLGSLNFFREGAAESVLVLILALASLLLTVRKFYRGLLVTGTASLCIVLFIYVLLQERLKELAEVRVQTEWGWGILAIGAVSLIATRFIKDANKQTHLLFPASPSYKPSALLSYILWSPLILLAALPIMGSVLILPDTLITSVGTVICLTYYLFIAVDAYILKLGKLRLTRLPITELDRMRPLTWTLLAFLALPLVVPIYLVMRNKLRTYTDMAETAGYFTHFRQFRAARKGQGGFTSEELVQYKQLYTEELSLILDCLAAVIAYLIAFIVILTVFYAG